MVIQINAVLAILFAFLQVADVVTTNKFVDLGVKEANPFVRFFMRLIGRQWWLAKIGIMLAVVAGLKLFPTSLLFTAVLLLLDLAWGYAFYVNLRTIRRRS